MEILNKISTDTKNCTRVKYLEQTVLIVEEINRNKGKLKLKKICKY